MVSTAPSPVALGDAAGGQPLLHRQLFDATTGTYTYLLADVSSGDGVLIDPVFEQHERDLSLIRELGIPTVVAVRGATRRIRDGALLEIDGSVTEKVPLCR